MPAYSWNISNVHNTNIYYKVDLIEEKLEFMPW